MVVVAQLADIDHLVTDGKRRADTPVYERRHRRGGV